MTRKPFFIVLVLACTVVGWGQSLKVTAFDGIGQTPVLDDDAEKPADTHIAVGHGAGSAGRVVEVTNNGVQIFDKNTSSVAGPVSLEEFGGAPPDTCFDPKVIYDRGAKRFTIVMSEGKKAEKSRVYVITSRTSSPQNLTSDWVRIVADAGTTIGRHRTWFDYPCHAVSAGALAITGNMKDNNSQHRGAVIRFYQKVDLLKSDAKFKDVVFDAAEAECSFVLQPVHEEKPTSVARFVSRCAPREMRLVEVDCSTSEPRIAEDNKITWNGGRQLRTGAPQGGSEKIRIATSSGRMMQAVSHGGDVWCVSTADVNGDDREEACWFRVSGHAVLSHGSMRGRSDENWTYLPSIAVNGDELAGVTYTESGPKTSVTSRFALLRDGEVLTSATLMESKGAYDGHEPHNPEKWGDYSATVVDPDNDAIFWCATDYVKKQPVHGDDGEWGTVIARVELTIETRGASTAVHTKEKPMLQNSLMVITPYWSDGTWVFDDDRVGLVREPFVQGVPDMIDDIVADIPDARKGFKLVFSGQPFPGYQAKLDWQREEMGGNWYKWTDKGSEGWLCPALFKYFERAPEAIYCKAEPLKRG